MARVGVDRHGTRCVSVLNAISAIAPAVSTPVGPPPTTTKVRFAWRFVRVVGALGALEGEQHPPPDLERVLDRLQAGRVRSPTRRCRSTSGSCRWRRRGSRTARPRRRRGRPCRASGSTRDHLGEQHAGVRLVGEDRRGSGGRCSTGSAPPSPPGRAAAGTGDGSGDRSPSPRTSASASPRAAARPPNPPPTINTRGPVMRGNVATARTSMVRSSG